MRKHSVWLLAALAALAVVACNMQKGPAEQAVAGAEAALNAVRDQAQKYAPEQLGSAEAQLGQMKDAFEKGDYAGVLAQAPAMTAALNQLKDAAAKGKADAEAALAKAKDEWGPASTAIPKMVDELAKRVETLSKERRLPKGVTKESVAAAKTGLDSLKSTWADATNASSSGDFTTAMSKAAAVKAKAAELMKSVGMTPPS
jgi:flagellar biosynthesis chaperone FliJ